MRLAYLLGKVGLQRHDGQKGIQRISFSKGWMMGLVLMTFLCFFANPLYAKHLHKRRHRARTVTTHRETEPTPRPLTQSARSVSIISGSSQLSSTLNSLINAGSANAYVAVYVRSMQDGSLLYGRNINQPLMPASTLKIFTAEAALVYLGPDYHFSTQLYTDAKTINRGILKGNLYVVLSGDPSLTYGDLIDLMGTLRSENIQGISGNLYIDDTAYDQDFYGPGWEWKDKKYCYGAPIGASIINHNCLSFQVTPASTAGRSADVVKSSKYFYPTIKNSIVTKNNNARCALRLSSDSNSSLAIDGCMPKGRYAWGVSSVVSDIPQYNRALFSSLMQQLNIKVGGSVQFGRTPQNISLMATHASKPLRDLITDMLKKSDNIIAGALFKKVGQLYTKSAGSWQNGSVAVSQILASRAKVNTAGMRILDGSGLSPANLATPSQMMQVLDFTYHNNKTSEDFISALPIAGVDGTLKHRMGNIARKVRAKTGTISGVATLAGYATSGDKEPLAFVIMINGSKGLGWRYKALEDKIATALTRYHRA